MVIYGLAASVIPLILRNREGLGLRLPHEWARAVSLVLVWLAVYYLISTATNKVYTAQLVSHQVVGDVRYDYGAAHGQVMETASEKIGWDLRDYERMTPLGTLVWAPIVEELLYRGYGFNSLMARNSFLISSTVTTAFFALRHAVQLLVLSPIAVVPIVVWMLEVIPFGYMASHAVRRTGSILPAMLLHFLVNLLAYLGLIG